ncbi:UNKNOWN [Stylonychia lemnae]|uniref:DUF4868 domain-containing protein n=1 Tax=Stylonychia lemnae TaxID=5949 RepID=A0A078A520_STYLE|nr:UNKNOWN [Stylonychia lemnae]|eukprot:CDW77299.1 UNKNOWN [Stylonychia lemnae]
MLIVSFTLDQEAQRTQKSTLLWDTKLNKSIKIIKNMNLEEDPYIIINGTEYLKQIIYLNTDLDYHFLMKVKEDKIDFNIIERGLQQSKEWVRSYDQQQEKHIQDNFIYLEEFEIFGIRSKYKNIIRPKNHHFLLVLKDIDGTCLFYLKKDFTLVNKTDYAKIKFRFLEKLDQRYAIDQDNYLYIVPPTKTSKSIVQQLAQLKLDNQEIMIDTLNFILTKKINQFIIFRIHFFTEQMTWDQSKSLADIDKFEQKIYLKLKDLNKDDRFERMIDGDTVILKNKALIKLSEIFENYHLNGIFLIDEIND